jgi:hypothetical protein
MEYINKPSIIFPAEESDQIFYTVQPTITLDLEND